MATRVVEGKKPYTGGEAIDIDQNKVISLKLRDENNLIIYDSGDNEIYVDLQLPDGITPTDAFPVGVTTGRAVVADGWDKAGTIICAKTTSGDNIKLLYADDGTLWIDNGTGTFKEIPLGGSAGADIEYVTQVEYDALPSSKLTDGKHYVIYTSDSPTPPSPGWQPGANTIGYRPLTDDYDDYSGNGYDFNSNATNLTTVDGVKCCDLATSYCDANITITALPYTIAFYNKIKNTSESGITAVFYAGGDWGGSGVLATTSGIYIRYGNTTDTDQTRSFTPDGDWHLFVVTFSATGGGLYIDGQLFQTLKNPQSDPNNNGTPFYIGHDFGDTAVGNAYMGAVILENKARSTQDVSDYYDQTKANYGIS